MNLSIFRKGEQKEKWERHRVIHQVWKKKLFVPFLNWLEKKTRKLIVQEAKDLKNPKRYRLIPFIWKKRLLTPVIYLLKRKIKKFMIKEAEDIPKEVYNQNIKVLFNSFEEGAWDWLFNFKRGFWNGKKNKQRYAQCEKEWELRHDMHWYKIPKFFIRLISTIYLEDTAYRELLNTILFRVQANMNRLYNPEIKHKIPLYVNMQDGYMPFFVEWKRLGGGGKILFE